MPWRVKRSFLLILLGFVAAICAVTVLIRHRSVDTDLLAVIGIAGGLAMVLVSLPSNGKNDDP